jgi:hypothetical protein
VERISAGAAGWEESGVPPKEPVLRQRFREVAGRVERHCHDAFDVAVGRGERASGNRKAAGAGRSHGGGSQLLALDVARLQNFPGESPKEGLLTQREPDSRRPSRAQAIPRTICGD